MITSIRAYNEHCDRAERAGHRPLSRWKFIELVWAMFKQ